MKLTIEERKMLQGERGFPVQKSMELLVALGEIQGAKRLIPVSHAHIAAGSVVTMGEEGVSFIEELASRGGKFVIPATLTSSTLDPFRWEEMGIAREYFNSHMALLRAYLKMDYLGPGHTCTPYEIGHVPRLGEHVAWGESSAVVFANAVLGARTNREGGPAGLAAALTGRMPLYGYRLDENRYGDMKIVVTAKLESITDYGCLGYYVGKIGQVSNPVFVGIPPSVSWPQLKALSAALATSGAIAMYHAVGVTPEANTEKQAFGRRNPGDSSTFEFGEKELRETMQGLSKAETDEVGLVILGCPHASVIEIREIARLISGRKVHPSVGLWILTSTPVKAYADRTGYTEIIEAAGGKIICETCPVTMPKEVPRSNGYKVVTVDSAKLAHYVPGNCGVTAHFGSTRSCVDAAIRGSWR